MKPFTAAIPYCPEPFFKKTLLSLMNSALVERVVIINPEPVQLKMPKCHLLVAEPLSSHQTLHLVLDGIQTKYLLLISETKQISIEPNALERFLEKAEIKKACLVYSDFYDERNSQKTLHPLIDYQLGSVRDDFDFGALILFSVSGVRNALKKYGLIPGVKLAGLYDLRLKVSIDHAVVHLPEPLYSVMKTVEAPGKEKIFSYVDPKNFVPQKEMERVFTDYLKKIGAFLPSHFLKTFEPTTEESFPVEASIVTPVRNRKEIIAEAIKSALSQEADFSFNLIVVDNHSTDGTTAILSKLSRQFPRLKHIIPKRIDLGIGGCWNEALASKNCGRYVVQLDSDDLYSSTDAFKKIIHKLRMENYAMVIGSYTLVDSALKEIPPGLIDHREWTDENGHNNALRINGLGAPRAFNTQVMRKIGFPNVSYGEDYAAALRICREYQIGRIYESLYLCRRWSGNTDAGLSIEKINRNDAFKDKIRTEEILARQKIVKEKELEAWNGGMVE